MGVDARLGIFRDRVIVDGTEFPIRRAREGWRTVDDVHGAVRRVRYDGWRDRIVIESPEGLCQIRFRWRHTTFAWRDRTYRIQSSTWSGMRILDGDRAVAEGQPTWSGFRFRFVDAELRPIERELAIGLALRTAAFAIAMASAG